LTAQERSQIARIAASARWETGKVKMQWHKILTDSDAQQDTLGAKMPFLRFTKENIFDDHRTWFREVFFANLRWIPNKDKDGRDYEEASINVHVIILKNDIGVRQMHLDHKPHRANNHGAPTTHLHYDEKTRRALEKQSLTGHQIIVEKNLQGTFSLSVL
jgi:hypothetical protein